MKIIEEFKALDETKRNAILVEVASCRNPEDVVKLAKAYDKEMSEEEAQEILNMISETKPVKTSEPVLGMCLMCDSHESGC